MNELKNKIEQIFNTLSLSYYLKNNLYKASLEECETSYHDRQNRRIVVSFNNINEALANIQNLNDLQLEFVIRGLLYHECAHALLTPMNAMQEANKNQCEYFNSNILNLLEDERIETLTKNDFVNVDFVKNKNLILGGMPRSEALNSFTNFLFYFVRLRQLHANEFITKEANKIFIDMLGLTKNVNAETGAFRFISDMRHCAKQLYELYTSLINNKRTNQEQNERKQIEQTNEENNEENERTNQEQNEQSKNANEEENEITNTGALSKALSEIENHKANEQSNKSGHFKDKELRASSDFNIDLICEDKALKSALLKILHEAHALGSEISYTGRHEAGTFNTKFYIKDKLNALVNNQDFKRFDNAFKTSEDIKNKEEMKTLNLILDNSGSFRSNNARTNEIIKTLMNIEKLTHFKFRLFIFTNDFYEVKDKARFSFSLPASFTRSFGLNDYSKLLNEIVQSKTILLTDGDIKYRYNSIGRNYANTKENYYSKNLKCLNSRNVVIISDYDNQKHFEKITQARIIYSNNYCEELSKNIIEAFKEIYKR